MNPDDRHAESTLRSALAAPPITPETGASGRQDRLKSALHTQSAARDACHFLIDGVTAVLGWMILTLLSLVVPGDKTTKPTTRHRDEHE